MEPQPVLRTTIPGSVLPRMIRLLENLRDAGDALWGAGEEHEPTRSYVLPICVGIAITLLLVLRRVDGVTNPQFWAEDASVFFQENLKLGCWQALHTFFRGFPYLGQRLVACAATPLPFGSAPLFYNGVAYVVSAASLASFTLPGFRRVIRSDALRVIFCCAVAALPQATELIGNVTNLGWYLGIWLMLLPLMELPQSLLALAILWLACLLATFSTPVSILAAPVWLARALHALSGRRFREATFATLAAGASLVLIYAAGSLGRDPGAPSSLATSMLHGVSMLVLADAAVGPSVVLSLAARLGTSVVYPIALALLTVLATLAWLGRLRSIPVLVYCTYGILASSALVFLGHRFLAGLASTLDSLVRSSAATPWLFSGRYHVLGVSLVYLAVLATIDGLPGRTSCSIVTATVMVWLLATEASSFVLKPFLDLDWPSQAAHLEKKVAGRTPEPVLIPINPDRLGYAFNIAIDRRVIASDVNVPAVANLGPLLDTTRFEQSFVARCADLSEIDLFFGREGRAAGTVRVEVRDEESGHVVAALTVPADVIASRIDSAVTTAERQIRAGEIKVTADIAAILGSMRLAHALYFAPIRDSSGRRYLITVTASGSAGGNSLDLYGTDADAYRDGSARRDGESIAGDIAFRYGCTRP